MLNVDLNTLSPSNQEEMRIVYVGITRPRKVLMLAVPDEDVKDWKNKCIAN